VSHAPVYQSSGVSIRLQVHLERVSDCDPLMPAGPVSVPSVPSTRVLSPGGGVYNSEELVHRGAGKKSSRMTFKTPQEFITAIHDRMKEQEVSPVKPVSHREISAETRRLVAENEWMRDEQARQQTLDAFKDQKQDSKNATRDALLWSHLQEESQAVLPHLHELDFSAKEAEAEAQRLREENAQVKLALTSPRRGAPQARSVQSAHERMIGTTAEAPGSPRYGSLALQISSAKPLRVSALPNPREVTMLEWIAHRETVMDHYEVIQNLKINNHGQIQSHKSRRLLLQLGEISPYILTQPQEREHCL